MERKLYRGIMTPAMIATWILVCVCCYPIGTVYKNQVWLHIKLACVIMLTVYHITWSISALKLIDNPSYKTHVFLAVV